MNFPIGVTYLFVDPGVTTGWAFFDATGGVIEIGQVVGVDEFGDWLDEIDIQPELVGIEEYRVLSMQKNYGSKVPTIQVVGMVRRKTRKWGAKFVEIPTQVKPVGYKWAGLKPESDHSKSHQFDAFVIGVWWLQKNGIRKSRLTDGSRTPKK